MEGLHELAEHISKHGRKGDTTLVHMAPSEVAALQQIAEKHGTSLTINPHTGLPEANPLLALLPMLAGAAGSTMLPASMAGIAGWGIPLLAGGITAGVTGDIGKGLLAGLGAWGGAGLAKGLIGQGGLAGLFSGGARQAAQSAIPSQAASLAGNLAKSAVPNTAFPTGASFMGNTGPAFAGASAQTAQEVAKSALTPWTTAMYGSAALAPAMARPQGTDLGESNNPQFNFAKLAPDFMSRPTYSGLPNVSLYARPYSSGGQVGIGTLGAYSDGGQVVRGPGDGMSDSIPAMVNGQPAARLTTEEFVIPADVVSHLGNGSSDAGASRLYEMMNRVRSARTGSAEQAPAVDPMRFIPA